ncbi:MAG: acyl carrier protein [Alphaproteobacteria bacterium]|nr:acyl carrier protein [Alphaproteobacteria bacterium]
MSATSLARKLLAETLAIGLSDLPSNPRIGTIEQWDSLAHMRILLALEELIGTPLDPDTAVTIESLEDIARVIERYR